MAKNILTLVLLSILISCGGKSKKEDIPSQMERVMAIHDEVMPKMGALGKLVGELKSKIDTTTQGQQYEAAMKDLQASHKSMMDWMQNFGKRFEHDEILNGKELTPQKQKWLNEEEKKVKALKEQINSSIEQAKNILKNQ